MTSIQSNHGIIVTGGDFTSGKTIVVTTTTGSDSHEAVKRPATDAGPSVFIVHGHDHAMKLDLKNYLQNVLGLPEPIILHERPSLGRTIVEKFEEEAANVDLVMVLLTPDDRGARATDSDDLK